MLLEGGTEEGSAPSRGLRLLLCVRWETTRRFWAERCHYLACKITTRLTLGELLLISASEADPHAGAIPETLAATLQVSSLVWDSCPLIPAGSSTELSDPLACGPSSFPSCLLHRVKPVSTALLFLASWAQPHNYKPICTLNLGPLGTPSLRTSVRFGGHRGAQPEPRWWCWPVSRFAPADMRGRLWTLQGNPPPDFSFSSQS